MLEEAHLSLDQGSSRTKTKVPGGGPLSPPFAQDRPCVSAGCPGPLGMPGHPRTILEVPAQAAPAQRCRATSGRAGSRERWPQPPSGVAPSFGLVKRLRRNQRQTPALRIIFLAPSVFWKNSSLCGLGAHSITPLSLSSELSPSGPWPSSSVLPFATGEGSKATGVRLLFWVKFSSLEPRRGRGLQGQSPRGANPT